MKRKHVMWRSGISANASNKVNEARLKQYIPDVKLSHEDAVKIEPYIKPGTLWQVAVECFATIENFNSCSQSQPYPYGNKFNLGYIPAGFVSHRKGAMSIYIGTTVVQEQASRGPISIRRHTFMVEGIVYLVKNIADFTPVT